MLRGFVIVVNQNLKITNKKKLGNKGETKNKIMQILLIFRGK